jgi:3-hydroxybutyryl-CoA dehydrogenase
VKYPNVGVVGAGVMGVGLAQHLAATGHRVVVIEIDPAARERAPEEIASGLRLESLTNPAWRGLDHAAVLERVELSADYGRLEAVDFVIENATESLTTKQEIYPRLDRVCREDCVFAANTSAIPIGRLADTMSRPARLIGIHFMNPVARKPVVEVIRGAATSDATVRAAETLLGQMEKRAIVVRDAPGFVSNRVLMLTLNEAIHVIEDDVARPEDVDDIFVSCFAHEMGPLATADLIGLDTVLRSLEVLHDSYGDDKFRPCRLLQQMVEDGLLGRKSGRGFFEYHRGRR